MNQKDAQVIFFAILASILWGLSFPVIILGLEDVQPVIFGTLRFLLVTPLLVACTLFLYGRRVFTEKISGWGKLCALGVTSITAPVILQNIGMQSTTAHISSILQSTSPVFVLFLAFLLLREPLTARKIGGILIASAGTYLVIMGTSSFSMGSSLEGNILVLLSAVSYAISSIIAKSCLNDGMKPIPLLTLSTLPGTLFLLLLTPLFEEITLALSPNAWIIIVFLAAGPSLLATMVWYIAMEHREISRLSFFVYLIPLFATLFSYLLLGEQISVLSSLSAILIIIGVALAQSRHQ